MTPLHRVGDFLRNLLLLVPLWAVKCLFLAVPVTLLVWVLWLPREQTTPPDDSGTWTANLKVGAALALLAQIVIYALLG